MSHTVKPKRHDACRTSAREFPMQSGYIYYDSGLQSQIIRTGCGPFLGKESTEAPEHCSRLAD